VGKVTIETENVVFDEAYCAAHPGFACGAYVLLSVSDDGSGMDAEVLEHLFEPFFTTKEVGKGTAWAWPPSMALSGKTRALSRSTVNRQGDDVQDLPAPLRGGGHEPTAVKREEVPRGHGETVLLVEDEAVILNVSRAMLERLGIGC